MQTPNLKSSVSPFRANHTLSKSQGVPVLNLTGIHIPHPSTDGRSSARPEEDAGTQVSAIKIKPQKYSQPYGKVSGGNIDSSTEELSALANYKLQKDNHQPKDSSRTTPNQESQKYPLRKLVIQPEGIIHRSSLKKITEKSIPASDRSLRETQDHFSDQRLHRKVLDPKDTPRIFELNSTGSNQLKRTGVTQSLDRNVLPELARSQQFMAKQKLNQASVEQDSPQKHLRRSTKESGSDYFRGKRPVVLERETYSEVSKYQPTILAKMRKEKEFTLTGRVNSKFFVPNDGSKVSPHVTRSPQEESAWAAHSTTVKGVVEELTSSFRRSTMIGPEQHLDTPDRTARDFAGSTLSPAYAMTASWRNLRADGGLLPDRSQAVKISSLLNSLSVMISNCQQNQSPSGKLLNDLLNIFEEMVSDQSKYSTIMKTFIKVIRSGIFVNPTSRSEIIQNVLYLNDPELNAEIFDPRHLSTHNDLVGAMITGYSQWKRSTDEKVSELHVQIKLLQDKLARAEAELATRDSLCLGKQLDIRSIGQEPRHYLLAAYDPAVQLQLLESDIMRKLLELGENYKTSWTNETNYAIELEEVKKQLHRMREEKFRLENTVHLWQDFKSDLELKLDGYEVCIKSLTTRIKEIAANLEAAKSSGVQAGLGIKVNWEVVIDWKMRERLMYPQGAELDTADIMARMKQCIERLEQKHEAAEEQLEKLRDEIYRVQQQQQVAPAIPSLKKLASKNKTQRELTHSITGMPQSLFRLNPTELESKRSQRSKEPRNGSEYGGMDTPGLPKSPEKSLILGEAELGRLHPNNRFASMAAPARQMFTGLESGETGNDITLAESPRRAMRSRENSPLRVNTMKWVHSEAAKEELFLVPGRTQPRDTEDGGERRPAALWKVGRTEDDGSILDIQETEEVGVFDSFQPAVPEDDRVRDILQSAFQHVQSAVHSVLDNATVLQQQIVETHHALANFYAIPTS